eukprot:COSAG01_NODE_36224_length_520_cov_1.318290_1_plen_102_part_10
MSRPHPQPPHTPKLSTEQSSAVQCSARKTTPTAAAQQHCTAAGGARQRSVGGAETTQQQQQQQQGRGGEGRGDLADEQVVKNMSGDSVERGASSALCTKPNG